MSQLSSNTLNTLQTVYYDDFDEDKKYYRILFRPATAVQARELTQLQTILQSQIQRFGSHVFKDGSVVDGVAVAYLPKVPYVVVADEFITNTQVSVINYNNSYLLTNSTNSNNAIRAVIKVAKAGYLSTYPESNRFYIDYIRTGKTGANSDIDVTEFQSNDTIYIYGPDQDKLGTLQANNLIDSIKVFTTNNTANATGYGYGVSVSEGVIYQKGFFSKVLPQVLIVKDFDTNPNNYVVGFETVEEIITENQDTTLNDNASGFYNYNAPGAHRLKLTPTLVAKQRGNSTNSTNFFAITEFDGNSASQQQTDPVYNKLGEEFARRTAEESGDYVVRPFQIDSYSSANSSTFLYEVSPGTAYVRGYRVELIGAKTVETERAFTTEVSQNQIITANYGNYIIVDEYLGTAAFDTYSEIDLYDTAQNSISELEGVNAAPSGAVIGKANIRNVVWLNGIKGTYNSQYAVYLFNIIMNSGQSFSNVKSIYSNGAYGKLKADIVLEDNKALIYDGTKNSLVFNTGITGTRRLTDGNGVNDTSFIYRQTSNGTLQTNGHVVFTIASTPQAGGVERLDYSVGGLSDANENDFNLIIANNAFTNNMAGTITVTSGSNTVAGASTFFENQLEVGDTIRVGSGAALYTVTAINSNTSLNILQTPISSYSANVYQRYFMAGSVLKTTGPNTEINIISNTQFSVSTGLTFNSAVSVYGQYLINRTAAVPASKEIRKNRLVKINCSNNAANTAGPWNLGVVDIAKINHIYVGTDYSNTNPDRLDWFIIDNGQRDDMYDHGKLFIRPAYATNISASTRILVDFDHFVANTTNGAGFFSVDSYPVSNTANSSTISYAEIPKYKNLDLRNLVDFRAQKYNTANTIANTNPANTSIPVNPVVSNSSFTANSTNKSLLAEVDSNITADIEFYLPRRDLLVINKEGDLFVRKGVAKLDPILPFNERDTVVLAETFVPPFPSLTVREGEFYGRKDIATKINIRTTKGYTMKDIAALEQRIKRLEYYTVLNALEQQARDLTIPDTNGLNRFKNGIFADPFNSHGIGNATDFEYKISIDKDNSIARPYFKTHPVDFKFNSNASSGVVRTGNIITLPYNHESFINQRYATKYRNTTESIWTWNGKIDLYPKYDYYRDEKQSPNQNVFLDFTTPWDEFANSPFGTIFGDWRNIASNTSVRRTTSGDTTTTTTTTNTTQQRLVTEMEVDTITQTYNLGSYVSDFSIQPYMRSRVIAFVAYNMKPNTTLHAFFDDTNVDAHIAPGVLSGLETFSEGQENGVVNQNGAYGAPILSDSNGFVCGLFKIPEGQFRVGDRTFRLTDVDDLVAGEDGIITSGSAIYSASSMSVTKGSTTITTATPDLIFNSNTVNRVVTTQTTTVRVNPPAPTGGGGGGGNLNAMTCFVAGCEVTLADGTKKKIEDVVVGDILKGHTNINRVIDLDRAILDSPVRKPILYGFNGGKKFVTAEHPFMTVDGWKAVNPDETMRLEPHLAYLNIGSLAVGDKIVLEDKSLLTIESIEEYVDQEQQIVYNFFLDGDHTYFVDGMLVHNKDPIAQSFFINTPDASSGTFLTKVGVFFKRKDPNLGITCYICEMRAGAPDFTNVVGKGHLESNSVLLSDNGTVETQFILDTPVMLTSGHQYAFVLEPDGWSPEYLVWMGETGGIDVATNEQVYSNPYVGTSFVSSNKVTWTTIQKEDVKFNIYRARFTGSTGTAVFNNEDDEYLTIDGFVRANSSLAIEIGDVVYSINSVSNTVNIANTDPFGVIQFVDEGAGVIHLDSAKAGFSNTVNPTIAIYRTTDKSNTSLLVANTLIATGNIVSVDNLKYSTVVPKFASIEPLRTQLNYRFRGTDNTYVPDTTFKSVINEYDYEYIDKLRIAASRSNEAIFNSNNKSSTFEIDFSSDSTLVSPVVSLGRKSSLFVENIINNDSTNEHTRYGNALTKYVSKRVILADGQEAEDLVVYMTAYRPVGTNVEVYVKFKNQADGETFESKVWTKLEYADGGDGVYSNPLDVNNFIEYKLGVPTTNAVAMGAFANSDTAVVQYTNNNGEIFYDGFKEYAIKMVLLSENAAVVPRLNDVRAIALQI